MNKGAEVMGEIKGRRKSERGREFQADKEVRQNRYRRSLWLVGWCIISAGCMPPLWNWLWAPARKKRTPKSPMTSGLCVRILRDDCRQWIKPGWVAALHDKVRLDRWIQLAFVMHRFQWNSMSLSFLMLIFNVSSWFILRQDVQIQQDKAASITRLHCSF